MIKNNILLEYKKKEKLKNKEFEMQRSLADALKKIKKDDFSGALVQLYIIYNRFHKIKHKIALQNPNKNFKAIINSDCKIYKTWREEFLEINHQALTLLKAIEKHSQRNEKNYIGLTGDDILKKTITLQKHCDMFSK